MASSTQMPCPDPSLHRESKMQEAASTAALLAASPRSSKVSTSDILDKDNRLSSKSAAMSLKRARPEDLPSYPSSGGVAMSATAGAANLATDNRKQFEHWKPDPSSAAGKAALLAKDYKMAPHWKPDMSAAGSKAALIAHKDGSKLNLWTPGASAEGNSAASQAFKKTTLSPNVDYGYTTDGRNRALLAATASVSRARSGSMPSPSVLPAYPDSANSAHNALNAATSANRRPSTRTAAEEEMTSPAMEQSRIRHLSDKISRDMFTDNPPVDLEVQEKKHQDALRASAVSMAKSMYDLQQKRTSSAPLSQGNTAATAAAGHSASITAQPDIKEQAMQYIHLQEAAHRLAEERLAKMDPDGAARYREHYGYPLRSPRRKLSIKDRHRGRADSEPQMSDSDDDDFRSRRIRNQMSQFDKNLAAVDEKKRQTDRAALLAAAERKVQAQMRGMDEKVYAETGKVSQAKLDEWEAKAREKATKDSARRTENHGKADIGGGKFMDQADIEAIAAARLKPTLDEITENAEKRRARDEEIRLDMEEKKRQEAGDKQREKEVKALQRRTHQEEKEAAKKEKAELKAAHKQEKEVQKMNAKMERDAEKSRKQEAKHAAQEEKRRSREVKKDVAAATAVSAAAVHEADKKHSSDAAEPMSHRKISSEDQAGEDEGRLAPIISRNATGEPVLRPDIERHVSTISTSSSEEGEHAIESKSRPTTPGGPAKPIDPANASHVGTDGPIGTAAGADPTPADRLDRSLDSPPSTPKSPHRISRLFGRLRGKSKSERDTEPGTLSPEPKDGKSRLVSKKSGPKVTSPEKEKTKEEPLPAPSAAVEPTETDLGPLSAVEAHAIAEEHKGAAAASPSSFVRGAPRDDDHLSSLSSLTSDEPEDARRASIENNDKVDGEKAGSHGLGIGNLLPTLGKGKDEGRSSSIGAVARSPVRETRFQEVL